MKFLVVLAVAVACAAADVSHIVKSDESQAPILRSDYEQQPEGHFQYAIETGNGIVSQAEGVVKNPASENAALEVKGTVRYTAPDGTPISLEYVADESGYHPTGSHLPVPPPIPEQILRAQKFIADHPAPIVKKTV
ncbi:larval cuticle protein LCP-17-like [Vanessa atalanta]|uniref:larval cuticle protein LCP-17-like n=1 Tax=Vanessa atalanta TaxID=42275 RepID=UPI001FCCF164|nr:larval cuticle protein LCP-17-like [Vanessa atalanta]